MVHPPPLDENGDKDFWHFGLFVMNPRAAYVNLENHSHYRTKIKCFQNIIRDFYLNGFHADEATTKSINQAIQTETTIMILVKHASGGKASKKKTNITIKEFHLTKGLKVIAAITFHQCMEKEDKRNVSCAVSWLLIVGHKTVHPSEISGWRRQGFGLFMFICMIKHCYLVGLNYDVVANIYLQLSKQNHSTSI